MEREMMGGPAVFFNVCVHLLHNSRFEIIWPNALKTRNLTHLELILLLFEFLNSFELDVNVESSSFSDGDDHRIVTNHEGSRPSR
jgi:hypothetical protein